MPKAPLRAVLVNNTAQIGHHGCTVVNRQIEALAAAAGLTLTASVPPSLDPSALNWAGTDVVIVNGEGSLHGDRKMARQIAAWGAIARAHDRPAALINTVYQNNDAATADAVAAYDLISVRESLSAAELAKVGLSATVVPDLSLTWTPPPLALTGDRVVFNDSTLKEASAALFDLSKAFGGPFFSLMTKPPLLPDYPDRNRKRRWQYYRRQVAWSLSPSAWKRASVRHPFPDPESLVAWMAATASVVVTGRFHGLCLSLLLGIPVLALRSNTHKVEGLLSDAGLSGRVVALTDLPARLAPTNRGALAYSDAEKAQLATFLTESRAQAAATFRSIAELAQARR